MNSIEPFALALLSVLRHERAKSDRLINSTEIIRRWKAKTNEDITDSIVREAVAFLCGEKGEPIGSISGEKGGYKYCLTSEEYDEANRHLESRIHKMSKHLNEPKKRFEREKKERTGLFASPVMQKLDKEFDLQPV